MTLLFRPSAKDVATVGFLMSRILMAVGGTMLIPAVLGVVLGEVDAVAALLIGASTAVAVGCCGEIWLPRHHEVRWSDGMVASGLSWLAVPLVGAIPLFLSGHFPQFLDAYFDAMSAFTTAGLSVVNDVDHLPESINLWRHLMQFLGGQGLVLLVLTFFAGGGGAVGMYAGEAREDKILPNVRRTARFIWRASLIYFAIGAAALSLALLHAGMDPGGAVLHAVNLFFAAFDTGGFSPRSASVGYYHSAATEAVLMVLMVAGAVSFAVHYVLWQGRGKELRQNIEARVLAVTFSLAMAMAAVGLVRSDVYPNTVSLLRRGLFQVLSAHTGTGFATVPGTLFSTGWGVLAPGALVLAMTIGGMSGSTTGGIKGIRIGLVGKLLTFAVQRTLLPRNAHQATAYHHTRPREFSPQVAGAATTILLLFLALYLAGTVVGLFYGYPLEEALFESTSAAATVGLSVGITSPSMETGLQITYVLQMFIGRLEFISVFALIGYSFALVKGRL